MTIYPTGFEDKIGFNEIRILLKTHCLCALGEALVDEMKFSDSYEEVLLNIHRASEYKTILLMEEAPPFTDMADITPILKHIRIEGSFINVEEMSALKRVLETMRDISAFFNEKNRTAYPVLAELSQGIVYYPFLQERIDSIIDRFGRIKDNASSGLASIRKELSGKHGIVSRLMQKALKQAQSEGWADTEAALSIRDGRTVIPVNSAYKRKIQGIVHDESSTGRTSYIEPAEVVEANNEIRELEIAERREIIKILTLFTEELRPYLPELYNSCTTLGIFDFTGAKAKLALLINAIEPKSFNKQSFAWERAVHPLMYLLLKKEGREVVPLDINLDNDNRILLISGPNAGGKSVCLKTVGIIQYMFQCGMLVPLGENSEIGFFNSIFIDIGDEQSIENDLSTYSSHLNNMKHFLRHSGEGTLLLIDEFGTGTEPALGGAIAETVLDHLNRKGAYGVITTHYTNLKHFAVSTPGLINGAMLYDAHRMLPLFKLHIGAPGSSFAFEIARKIGLPEQILKEAAGKVGQDHIDFDKHLRDILRDKRYWETRRNRIRQSGKHLEAELLEYKTELEKLRKERKAILNAARDEAKSILSEVNKRIENTIRTIKEAQADKIKTLEARKSLESFKAGIEKSETNNSNARKAEELRIDKKIEQLKAREQRKADKKPETKDNPDNNAESNSGNKTGNKAGSFQSKNKPETDAPLSAGDKVRLEGQEVPGEIITIQGKEASVAFGHFQMFVPVKRLKRISGNEYKRFMSSSGSTGSAPKTAPLYDPAERRLHFKPRIDVRGCTVEEAIRKTGELVDEAIMLGFDELRILHGKGNGILRQEIRMYLNATGLVSSLKDESEEFGGAGITVVGLI